LIVQSNHRPVQKELQRAGDDRVFACAYVNVDDAATQAIRGREPSVRNSEQANQIEAGEANATSDGYSDSCD
jgi:hypothetical protein